MKIEEDKKIEFLEEPVIRVTLPKVNLVLQIADNPSFLRFEFYVKKTLLNRFKFWMFCRFFPFKIIEWEAKEKK